MHLDFPDIFRDYVASSVKAALNRLDPDPDKPLSEEERDVAVHALGFGLKDDTAWPDVWYLLDKLAPKMEMAGGRGEWIPFLEQGISLGEQRDDFETIAKLTIHLSDLYRLTNQLDLSESQISKCIKISERCDSPFIRGRAFNRLAILALSKSQYNQAEQLSRSALAILPSDHVDRANSFYVLGTSKYELGKVEEAIPFLEKSCQIWQKSGSKRRYAWGLRNLGPALRLSGELGRAISCNEKAYSLLKEIGDIHSQAIVQMNLGIIKSNQEKYTEAISLYGEAIKTFQELGDVLHLARAYGNLGIEYRELGNYTESKKSLEHSIRLAFNTQHAFTICNSIYELWITYSLFGELEKAKIVLNDLLNRLNELEKDPSTKVVAQKFFADIEYSMEKSLK